MPIRRGAEYLESLRDGRRLWLMGRPVDDVTTHPALAGCARSVADVYDREVATAIKRFLAVLEPVLILGLAVLVGGIVFSILLGVMGMSELVI